MVACVDLVRFVLVAAVDGEQVEFFDEEVGLLRYRLRAHGTGQMPSVCTLSARRLCYRHGIIGASPYETLRVPVSVMRMLLTEMDSGLLSTSFPLSSVSWLSELSP